MIREKLVARMKVFEFNHAAIVQERGRAQQKISERSCDREDQLQGPGSVVSIAGVSEHVRQKSDRCTRPPYLETHHL